MREDARPDWLLGILYIDYQLGELKMRKLELEDFLNYRCLSEVCFSPDGRYGAVVVTTADAKENGYDSNIWIYHMEENRIMQMTFAGDSKSLLWISNTEFIFPAVRNPQDKKKLEAGEALTVYYRMSVLGGEASEYMRIPAFVSAIKWIEEDSFALTVRYDNNRPAVEGLEGEAKEAALKKLKEEKDYEVFDEIPFWANGIGIVNKRRNRLYTYSRMTKELTAVTDGMADSSLQQIRDGRLYFTAKTYRDIRQQYDGIFVYDIKDKTIDTLLAEGQYSVRYTALLGNQVIFIGSDHKTYGTSENPDVFLLEGGNVRRLADLEYGLGNSIGSDCRLYGNSGIRVYQDSLYMIVTEHCHSCLKRLDGNGSIEEVLRKSGSIDGFDICAGNILLVGMEPDRLQEMYVIDREGERRISAFNEIFTREIGISIPERLEVVSDGITVEGFVLKPAGYDPDKTYPGILDIHGGPKAVYGTVPYHEMQVWAARGYFVFFCNPRGSDGRGDEFADIRGKYGTIDYDDLMRFTDKVLQAYPQIDKERLGAAGGSYGGFMINWIIGHTDRFKCCCSQRSIANWISKCLTTDIGYYHNMDQQQSTPWVEHDKMWWHSPLKYADKVKTPTLFIHSDEDYRCWQAEGLQMFTALKYHGVPSRLCLFHGENHELSRSGKPLHRIRRLKEMTDWFEQYLK